MRKYIKPKMLPNKFPNVVEASGKPYDMGYSIGSELKDIIKKTVERWFNFLSSIPLKSTKTAQSAGIALPREDALNISGKMMPYAAEYAPDLVEECRGIAKGAGLKFEEIFHINCFLDMYDYVLLPSTRWKPWLGRVGCTTVGVSGQATESKKDVIIGQNYDLDRPETFQEASTILKLSPDKSPSIVLYTIAGAVGCAGLNSSGIGMVINKLWPSDAGPGVPYCFLVRKALQKDLVSDVLETVTTAKRASGAHFLITNSSGDIFSLEVTATKHEIISPTDGVYAHTNHYLTRELKPFDTSGPWIGNSLVRLSRIRRYLYENRGKITLEKCREWLKDHVNYPYSICRHGSEKEPMESGARTIASFFFLPKESRVLATYGNPCIQPYEEYSVPKL
jgi:isopenicillin-N N-acyltransferase-like protein